MELPAFLSRSRPFLDVCFIAGLAFSAVLANKVVPFLIVVGVIPIALLWDSRNYSTKALAWWRLAGPLALYFGFSLALMFVFPGLLPGEKRPINPNVSLYAIAIGLAAAGSLRGLQINDLAQKFQKVMPPSLGIVFVILCGFFLYGFRDDCRVKAEAAWPFIPAIIFTTLTFLTLLGWERMTRSARTIRLVLVALSIVVVLGLTQSRGIAIGQFAVLAALILLKLYRPFRNALPGVAGLLTSIAGGLALCALLQLATGCGSMNKLSAITDAAERVVASQMHGTSESPASAAPANGPAATLSENSDPRALSNDVSAGLRLQMWAVSIEAIKQAPLFGHGALSLHSIIQDKFGFEHNHNQYLTWLVTGGIVFLLFGLVFLATPFLVTKGFSTPDRLVATLSLTGLWAVAINFDSYFNLGFYLHYFCLMIGFVFAVANADPASDPAPSA